MSRINRENSEAMASRIRQVGLLQGLKGNKKIAQKVGMSDSHLGRLLRGELPWTETMLETVAFGLNVSRTWLEFGIEDEPDRVAEAIPTFEASAGNHWLASQDVEPVPTYLPDPQQMQGFIIHGDSMEPLVREKQIVYVFKDREPKDGDLAYVFVDELHVNVEMVRQGHSEFWTKYGRGRYAEAFEQASKTTRRPKSDE